MKFSPLKLAGAHKIDLERHVDDRGFFARQYCEQEFSEVQLNTKWVQMNTSFSKYAGTMRGFHFQRPPKAEIKMVRCIKGAIFDVIVDLRASSPTFSQWFGEELNADNSSTFYIPQGFAHGFQTLVDDTQLLYWHSEFYSPNHEGGLNMFDKDLNVDWPLAPSDISKRDQDFPSLKSVEPITL